LNGWIANNSSDRLTTPLVRRAGKLEEVSWDEAMKLMVQRSRNISRITVKALSVFTHRQLFLEEYYTLGVIVKAPRDTYIAMATPGFARLLQMFCTKNFIGTDGQPRLC
jgi:anaerobic selenocysteine-containing dehydrogenase